MVSAQGWCAVVVVGGDGWWWWVGGGRWEVGGCLRPPFRPKPVLPSKTNPPTTKIPIATESCLLAGWLGALAGRLGWVVVVAGGVAFSLAGWLLVMFGKGVGRLWLRFQLRPTDVLVHHVS